MAERIYVRDVEDVLPGCLAFTCPNVGASHDFRARNLIESTAISPNCTSVRSTSTALYVAVILLSPVLAPLLTPATI
jgi:hypothetical protein